MVFWIIAFLLFLIVLSRPKGPEMADRVFTEAIRVADRVDVWLVLFGILAFLRLTVPAAMVFGILLLRALQTIAQQHSAPPPIAAPPPVSADHSAPQTPAAPQSTSSLPYATSPIDEVADTPCIPAPITS